MLESGHSDCNLQEVETSDRRTWLATSRLFVDLDLISRDVLYVRVPYNKWLWQRPDATSSDTIGELLESVLHNGSERVLGIKYASLRMAINLTN